MHRFFLSPDLIQSDHLVFPSETAHQISRVLRLDAGKTVQVLDGLGNEYLVELDHVGEDGVSGKVVESKKTDTEPQVFVRLLVGLTQREKFEWILQKCTEIGVSAFVPMITSRSLVQKPDEVANKYPRWQKIIREAAEQSHRGIIPNLEPVQFFSEIVKNRLTSDTAGLIFWEEEQQTRLKKLMEGISNQQFNLMVGPEGGFTPDEVSLAQQAGYKSVSLGKRILRLETAALFAAGLVIFELE